MYSMEQHSAKTKTKKLQISSVFFCVESVHKKENEKGLCSFITNLEEKTRISNYYETKLNF
jgi:hypothetical protein